MCATQYCCHARGPSLVKSLVLNQTLEGQENGGKEHGLTDVV